jgi:hypothetical protein
MVRVFIRMPNAFVKASIKRLFPVLSGEPNLKSGLPDMGVPTQEGEASDSVYGHSLHAPFFFAFSADLIFKHRSFSFLLPEKT